MVEPLLITAPAITVQVPEVKEHLRILHDDEDDLIGRFIAAATRHFEWRTGRTVAQTEWEVAYDRFPCELSLRLPLAFPLISVTSIKYMDSTGVDNTWSASNYVIDTYRGRVAPAHGLSWPSFTPYPLSAVRIRYIAGQAIASPPVEIEAGIRNTISELVGALYENREAVVPSDKGSVAGFAENPVTKRLLEMYKVNHAY